MAEPFAHKRQIVWSDTDSAQVVYTVRFLDFAMQAVEAWWADTLAISWYDTLMMWGFKDPWVHFEADISAPLTPRHELESLVYVERVGKTSLSFRVEGHRSDGVRSFVSRLVCVFVDGETDEKQPLPDDVKIAATEYQTATS